MCCIQMIFRCEDGFKFECVLQIQVMKKVIRGQKRNPPWAGGRIATLTRRRCYQVDPASSVIVQFY